MAKKSDVYVEVPTATANTRVPNVSTVPGSVKKRLGDVENLTQAVLWVGISAVAAAIITSCALVIDQMHFNNQTYRDQSAKTDAQIQELNARIDTLQTQLSSQK